MDALADPLLAPLTAEAAGRFLLGRAVGEFLTFLLVLLRVAGLMTVGPLWGNQSIPGQARALLAFSVALLLTPTLSDAAAAGFARLDGDGDGFVSRTEVPGPSADRFERRLAELGRTEAGSLRPQDWPAPPRLPADVAELAKVGVTEFALGLALGLGVTTILSGLQLAGEMIDQQTGISLSEVYNPGFQELDGGVTGRFLFLFGTAVFLVMGPLDGHLSVLSALVDTFRTLPVGEATVTGPTVDLLSELVHVSIVLGIQVAAPVLAAMSLVALAMGYLGHSVPQVNVLVIGFPIRAAVNLGILALTFSGVSETLVGTLAAGLDALRGSLSGLP